jgi:hypothetical protein
VPGDPTGERCKAACDADTKCRAWTYAHPGYLGPEALCFLKDRIKPPRHKPCCISGVVLRLRDRPLRRLAKPDGVLRVDWSSPAPSGTDRRQGAHSDHRGKADAAW